MDVRLIADGEEKLCNDFYNRIYGKNRTQQQWQWEFIDNTYDGTPIPYSVVDDNGRIAGTQAFIPIKLIDKDGPYWTAKSEETLVDPDYRGKRLFEKMYALLFDYAKEHGFACIWGFTPANRAFARLGFTFPDKTEQLFMPFSPRSVAVLMNKSLQGQKKGIAGNMKIALAKFGCLFAQTLSSWKTSWSKKRAIADIEFRTMDRPDDQCGDLCRRFIDHYGGTTIYRDAAYLQWRLFDNPYIKVVVRGLYHNHELLGWTAFSKGDDDMGYLIDLMAVGDHSRFAVADLVRMLLVEAVTGTRDMGASGIRGWSVNDHPFDLLNRRMARQVGFYHIKQGHSVVLYNCDAGSQRASSDDFDGWYVTRIFTEGVFG